MSTNRFPCRLCGRLTDGDDAYVVCAVCADEYECNANVAPAPIVLSVVPPDLTGSEPLSAEVEARLRRLLDSW